MSDPEDVLGTFTTTSEYIGINGNAPFGEIN